MIASLLTKKELAAALGLQPSALTHWKNDGAPVEEWLEWSLPEAVALAKEWRANSKREHNRQKLDPDADGSLSQQLLAAKVRDTNAAARKKEIENQVRLGELWPADEVVSNWREAVNILRARMQELPDKLSSDLPLDMRLEHRRYVEEQLRLAMKELEATQLGPRD